MEKKILSNKDLFLEYVMPPRLVKAKQGWYFLFYQVNPASKENERFRRSYNINRIKSKSERKEYAEKILENIEELLPVGFPFFENKEVVSFEKFISLYQKKQAIGKVFKTEKTLLEVLEFIRVLKTQSESKDTNRTYNSRCKLLREYIIENKMQDLPVTQFKAEEAQDYLDSVRLRVGNNTYNNYRQGLIAVFNAMKKKKFIIENPFNESEIVRKVKKKRRSFTLEEAETFLEAVFEADDFWMLVLIALHAGEAIRRTECYRLKFVDVNLKDGYIHLDEHQSLKSKRERVITIPNQFMFIFLDPRFTSQPKNYFLFGENCLPHPNKTAGESSWKTKHRKYLIDLKIKGKLKDIEGLSLYSWKDTGLTAMSKYLNMFQLRDQAGHQTTDMTMRYYHSEKIINAVRDGKLPFFEKVVEKQKERLLKK